MTVLVREKRYRRAIVRAPKTDHEKEDFDRHFAIVVAGAERTRGVLYFFCLVLIVNFVFFFEDTFDTTAARLKFMNAANACIGRNLGGAVPVPTVPDEKRTCGFYYEYMKRYGIDIPHLNASEMNPQARMAFEEKYKSVLRDRTDSLSTNVPLLNIKIDRNSGLLLQNVMGLLVLFVLFSSLIAEQRALTSIQGIIKKGTLQSRAVSDIHVFHRTSRNGIVFPLAFFFPAAMQLWKIYTDLQDLDIVRDIYGRVLGPFYLVLELASLAAVSFTAYACFQQARGLNRTLGTLD